MNALQSHFGGANTTGCPQYAVHVYLWREGHSCPDNEISPTRVATAAEAADLEAELDGPTNSSSSAAPVATVRRSRRLK